MVQLNKNMKNPASQKGTWVGMRKYRVIPTFLIVDNTQNCHQVMSAIQDVAKSFGESVVTFDEGHNDRFSDVVIYNTSEFLNLPEDR